MNHLFCWISQNAAGLTAIFTFIYLVFTILIFNEARKSADAAKTSADAAAGSVALMSKEIDQQAIRRQTIVRTYVEAAIKTIGVWNAKTGELANMNSLKSIPPTDNLILPNSVVELAALIDVQAAIKLSAALTEMRLARDVIESTRNVDNKDGKNIGHFERAGNEAAKHLDAATESLQKAYLVLGKQNG